MLEKPALQDDAIIACVGRSWSVPVAGIAFLPIGNDSGAWAYRVEADDGHTYFLKVRRGAPYEPGLAVPRYLADSAGPSDQDMVRVVAPLPTAEGALWKRLGGFSLMLYPFIEGPTGMEVGLSNAQWRALGGAVGRIHASRLPPELLRQVRRETFVPPWAGLVRELRARIGDDEYADPFEAELAAFWRARRDEIDGLVDRAEALGRMLQHPGREFVLCHSDLHVANVLVDRAGRLHIVDWDAPLLAPRERDLMFVVGGTVGGGAVGATAEASFFRGYGRTDVDPLALAYYRYEWVVQEMGDYGERVFLMADVGPETKQAAVEGFVALFQPADVVESAYQSEGMLPPALRSARG